MPSFTTAVLSVSVSLAALLYARLHSRKSTTHPAGYVLHNQVTHARFLPTESAHAFTYPTLSLLVSLDALEAHELDLARGWLFSYGGLWLRLLGLRPHPYLRPGNASIRAKLEAALHARGAPAPASAWMMTMPSFVGWEGINPLTVYFCYDARAELWGAVLEVHNTFGENHVYILEIGRGDDPTPGTGFDHQWTFPREFHVSPFNDRAGTYSISIRRPTRGPTHAPSSIPPRPTVRVHLHTPTGALKLTALLRPTASAPLTTPNLLRALVRTPFTLFLSFPRILYVAAVLHYRKRLDVFVRPPPRPAAGGVRWLPEGPLERFARQRVSAFLHTRTEELRVRITLTAADPGVPQCAFGPTEGEQLDVAYLSPQFFVILFTAPSAAHALLLGCPSEFKVSSERLFTTVFSPPPTKLHYPSLRQRLRMRPLPPTLRTALPVPPRHALDATGALTSTVALLCFLALDHIEAFVFRVMRARIVPGEEPWKRWERAATRYKAS
ncbi:hypothetical protein BD779DRAFT_1439247 [Infundibulicybe gibba]|nr:hypothetical protein BD779DRAFT_1439247 [Infundibulicybe gibba]